jgi:hypothetical protein
MMTDAELTSLHEQYRGAFDQWYSNMLTLPKEQLAQAVLFHMPAGLLELSLQSIKENDDE